MLLSKIWSNVNSNKNARTSSVALYSPAIYGGAGGFGQLALNLVGYTYPYLELMRLM
jgi:hypothetical protein